MVIGKAMDDTGPHVAFIETGKLEKAEDWTSEPVAFAEAINAAVAALKEARPEGDPAVRRSALTEHMGAGFGRGVAELVADPASRGGDDGEWAASVRKLAGPIADRIARRRMHSAEKVKT
jgi:hypothetical protein